MAVKIKRGILLLMGALFLGVALCANLCAFDQSGGFILVKRQDTLECGLKDGSRFILRARYLWDPIAELIPADVTTRYGSGHIIEYQPRKGPAYEIAGTLDYFPGMWSPDTQTCSDAYVAGDIVYGWGMYFSRATGKPISLPDPPSSLRSFYDATTVKPISLDMRGAIHQLSPLITVSGATGSRVIYELAMIEAQGQCRSTADFEHKCPILAVYQSASADKGKTWSRPVVTTKAEIFELGKSMEEQSFIAKPIRINGKSVKSIERETHQKAAREERYRSRRIKAEQQQHREAKERYSKTLDSAIEKNDRAHFDSLLVSGIDISDPSDNPFRTEPKAPLLIALDKPEYAPFAITLINRGASLTPKGIYEGVTVLMLAAGSSTPEVMKALLTKQKFDINQRNPNGDTALGYAVAAGMADNVKLLLQYGADAGIKNGNTSLLEIARQQGHTEIVKLLEQH